MNGAIINHICDYKVLKVSVHLFLYLQHAFLFPKLRWAYERAYCVTNVLHKVYFTITIHNDAHFITLYHTRLLL
jgi:hypothetical protein